MISAYRLVLSSFEETISLLKRKSCISLYLPTPTDSSLPMSTLELCLIVSIHVLLFCARYLCSSRLFQYLQLVSTQTNSDYLPWLSTGLLAWDKWPAIQISCYGVRPMPALSFQRMLVKQLSVGFATILRKMPFKPNAGIYLTESVSSNT